MAIIKSLISAFSTYSKIPMPNISYKEGEGRYTICFFSLVGLIIMGLQFLWINLAWYAGIARYAIDMGFLLIPLVITGGIHLDGFMDVMDALHSYGDSSKRLEILSDPHIGAFSVIKLIEYIGVVLVIEAFLDIDYLLMASFGFVIARILSAISIVKLPLAKSRGMLFFTRQQADKKCFAILLIEFAVAAIFMIFLNGLWSLLPIGVSILCFFIYKYKSRKDFAGATGDTAGCFLCMTELAFIIAVAGIRVIRLIQ